VTEACSNRRAGSPRSEPTAIEIRARRGMVSPWGRGLGEDGAVPVPGILRCRGRVREISPAALQHPILRRPRVDLEEKHEIHGGSHNPLTRASLIREEWVRRELQRASARRTPEWRDLLHTQGGADRDRKLEASLQHCAPTCIAGIPAPGTGGVRASVLRLAVCARPTSSAGQATRGGAAYRALTLPLDHRVGADHDRLPGERESICNSGCSATDERASGRLPIGDSG